MPCQPPAPSAVRPGQRAGRRGRRARRYRLQQHHPARAGPGASEPATGTRSGVTDHHANHAQPAPHANRPVPGRLNRALRVGAQRAAGRGSFASPRARRHRERGHPRGHADRASRAAGGRSVLPSGRNSGNDHFRSGLLGHHQPEPTGAHLVRIRGRLSHRRCGGVDSAHPAGLRLWRCRRHERRRQALAGPATTTQVHRTPGGTDQPAQQDSSLAASQPAGPVWLIALLPAHRPRQTRGHGAIGLGLHGHHGRVPGHPGRAAAD